MSIQNHVHYNMLFRKNHLMGGGVMVKDLIFQSVGEKFKSPHLQFKLPLLLRWPN
jgi:hypothetical protein